MPEKTEGQEQYTPTRVEWLTLMVKASAPTLNLKNNGVEYIFFPSDDTNTIEILVRYYKSIPQNIIDKLIEAIKALIMALAKTYGWESWINIKIKYDVVDSPIDKNTKNK